MSCFHLVLFSFLSGLHGLGLWNLWKQNLDIWAGPWIFDFTGQLFDDQFYLWVPCLPIFSTHAERCESFRKKKKYELKPLSPCISVLLALFQLSSSFELLWKHPWIHSWLQPWHPPWDCLWAFGAVGVFGIYSHPWFFLGFFGTHLLMLASAFCWNVGNILWHTAFCAGVSLWLIIFAVFLVFGRHQFGRHHFCQASVWQASPQIVFEQVFENRSSNRSLNRSSSRSLSFFLCPSNFLCWSQPLAGTNPPRK